jgi:hypothetical protein
LIFCNLFTATTRYHYQRGCGAAIECLPFENPKLSAMAVSQLSEHDFAAGLDRAIARSLEPKLIEGRAVRKQAASRRSAHGHRKWKTTAKQSNVPSEAQIGRCVRERTYVRLIKSNA